MSETLLNPSPLSPDAGVNAALEALFQRCARLPALRTGVVWPCSADALRGALEAAEAGLIVPVLYGRLDDLRQLAAREGLDLSGCELVAAPDPEQAARLAALDAGRGQTGALMKGSLHSDTYLHAVLAHETGLLRGKLLSHCALGLIPGFARPLLLSDAALNIAPDTEQKRHICQNAIGLAHALGNLCPKVAVLAAVETVNTRMSATLDGAILAKMADRRQIVGGVVDGPIDLDAAIDAEAARVKRIDSPVAGCADILLAPDIEAGNVIYKDWSFMGHAATAGLVVGARVPLILTSRADNALSRRLSAAVARLYAHALEADPDLLQAEGGE